MGNTWLLSHPACRRWKILVHTGVCGITVGVPGVFVPYEGMDVSVVVDDDGLDVLENLQVDAEHVSVGKKCYNGILLDDVVLGPGMVAMVKVRVKEYINPDRCVWMSVAKS